MDRFLSILLILLLAPIWLIADEAYFQSQVLPAMENFCVDCHDPDDSDGDVMFLEVRNLAGLQRHRGAWRSAAVQLRNRTMPPPKKKNQPSAEERVELASWIDEHLRETACDGGQYAGRVRARRLNRSEYDRTIKDLFGIWMNFSESLPADGGAGEGFDNSGEALFLPPMLLERYLEAARKVTDRVIQSPRLVRKVEKEELIVAGDESVAVVSVYVQDSYRVNIVGRADRGDPIEVGLSVDAVPVAKSKASVKEGRFTAAFDVRFDRGTRALAVNVPKGVIVESVECAQFQPKQLAGVDLGRHIDATGLKPGVVPEDPRGLLEKRLTRFLPRAFRRPVDDAEVKPYLALAERALERGDPYEEALKLALRAILVSADFLFRIEKEPPGDEPMFPIDDHALAVRLSYFLWSAPPDATLRKKADEGVLHQPAVLEAEMLRMLNDGRSRVFAKSFVGQWLGTKDVGGRKAPTAHDVDKKYTPDIAKDMRAEVVSFFDHLVRKNRSALELIDADYTFASRRLAEWYGFPGAEKLPKDKVVYVDLPDRRRGGVLGMGAVLAMTSQHKRTSAVLRGAWVFDTLIGEPVPPPPASVPALEKSKKDKANSEREMLERHRDDDACRACHNIIDPIGFGLQHFDWVGRWRDTEGGKPVDAKGRLPTGESFDGSAELRQVLLETQREAFLRNLTRKMLAYALGRSLNYRDDCTIETLTEQMAANDYRMRSLIRGVVMSTPFRQASRKAE